jgi:excisionase family DNA binding protein
MEIISEKPIFTRLLTPNEVASFLGISRSFIYYLIQTGKIPTIRIGRICRICPQDLTVFIENNRNSSLGH